MIDYHIHTRLCNHARGNMESYVRKGIALGLQEICFLDHLSVSGEGMKSSMHPEEVGLYFYAVQRLKYRYRDQIRVRAGLEVEFSQDHVDWIQEIIRPFAFDAIGGSVHFVKGANIVSRRSQANISHIDFARRCMQYIEEMARMLEHDYFDIVCHLDVIKKFQPRLPKEIVDKIDELLSIIRYKNLTVEVNTSGKNHPAQEVYPGFDLLQKCRQKGIEITLASDAHHPDSVGQYKDQVLADLTAIGFTHLAGFNRRKRYQVPINREGGSS